MSALIVFTVVVLCAKNLKMSMADPFNSTVFIGFDTETSGKYPLESEVCEIGAVKYHNGKVIDEFKSLVRTREPMSDTVIKIHGITNEMLIGAPEMKDVIPQFHKFIQGGTLVAHHAPFDLGFLAVELENHGLSLPTNPVICSSRLSRNIIKNVPNHRLQTLITCLDLHKGQAHRAHDDALACLELAMLCIQRAQANSLDEVFKLQDGPLFWKSYSLNDLADSSQNFLILIEAIKQKRNVMLTYKNGNIPGRERDIKPLGIVRNPDGDFMVALDDSPIPKRFYLKKVHKIERI